MAPRIQGQAHSGTARDLRPASFPGKVLTDPSPSAILPLNKQHHSERVLERARGPASIGRHTASVRPIWTNTKAPFRDTGQVLGYLGRYTHKTAITNHRLVDFDGEHVRFRWRDYADGNKIKVMRLEAGEFIRRFLLHVLPRGFTRLRHYGLLANRFRAGKLARCRALLDQPEPEPFEPEDTPAMMMRLTGRDITVCEQCGQGPLQRTAIPRASPEAVCQAARPRPP